MLHWKQIINLSLGNFYGNRLNSSWFCTAFSLVLFISAIIILLLWPLSVALFFDLALIIIMQVRSSMKRLVVMNLHFPHFLALMMSSAKLHPVQNCMLFSHLHFSLPLTALPSAIFSSMVFSILLCIFWCGQRLLLSWFLFLWVVHAVVALILVHLIFSFFKIHDLHSCRSILLNSTASMSSRWRARWQTFFKAPAGMQNSAGCCLISHVF